MTLLFLFFMYAVCENICYANQVVCFPLPSISGTGAVRRSVTNVKQFLESLIWWLVYEAGKPLSATMLPKTAWVGHSFLSAQCCKRGGGGLLLDFIPRQPPPFWCSHSCPGALGSVLLALCWDLWAAQSSLASFLNPAPTDGIPVLAREESILLFSCGHCHLPNASPPLANFFF